ncbi:MAG: hypothetical protein EOP83_06405 [Verrucomicrobiaceae bacterium]|nr:MAG: hypothetical protein EOP83_06405 [Verrucomicrobiaceae bacterium]
MKYPLRFSLALLFALTGLSQAATTVFSLETDYTGPLTPAINTTFTQNRNLSNVSGLTPGESIQIQFIPDNPMAWAGSLYYPAGDLELTWTATIEISVDGHLLSYTDTWSLVALGAPEGGPGGVHSSYNPGPPLMMHTLDVPWGTDLSNISITLRDLSTFSGGNFGTSSMLLTGTLRTVTVPEPSALLMAGLLPATLLLRRRRLTV